MQPSDSQLTGVPQTVIIDPNTGLPQNIVIIQQESSAPKVVGILIIIYGALMGVLTLIAMLGVSLMTDPDSDLYSKDVADSPTIMYVILGIAVLCCIGQVVGGIFMNQKKKMGIHLVWVTILISFAADILMELTYPDYIAAQAGAMSTSMNIAFNGVCSIICGVIVAIPLMVTGSGMDDSSLIG
jgi:hypothetical protein|tara:strand:+ start:181 stop:732 length:552 start_codon:yes stop_codon:yes gene_type:complete